MNSFQDMFDRQKRYFAAGVTRSHAWRIEQLATFDQLNRRLHRRLADLGCRWFRRTDSLEGEDYPVPALAFFEKGHEIVPRFIVEARTIDANATQTP